MLPIIAKRLRVTLAPPPTHVRATIEPPTVDLYNTFPELMPIANRLADAARGGRFSGQGVYREVSVRQRKNIKWALSDEDTVGLDGEELQDGVGMDDEDWKYEEAVEEEGVEGGPTIACDEGPAAKAGVGKANLKGKGRNWRRALCDALDH